jgi:pyruvate-ferredoxin/flavodoxin oxidoreductase
MFEDNAEFGLRLKLGADIQAARARALVGVLASQLPAALVESLLIAAQRMRLIELGRLLAANPSPDARALLDVAHTLVPRSVWIVGGDGYEQLAHIHFPAEADHG